MQSQRSSRNAQAVAAIRAAHRRYDSPLIYDDPCAYRLCGPGWRSVLRFRVLHALVFRRLLHVLRPVHGQVLARARFAEDHLEGAVRRGVRQYIVLGAGFDSFAVRMPAWARTLRVFELDRPETLAEKRRRLERAGLGCPDNLEFVPVDFERESLDEVLGRSSFTPAAPSFFSWLGVVVYLTSESIHATLKSIESVTPPGSELVFDYMLPDHLVESRERGVIDYVRRVGMRRGEPYVSYHEPNQIATALSRRGFRLLEDLSPSGQHARYFAGRNDDLRPWASSHFVHARRE